MGSAQLDILQLGPRVTRGHSWADDVAEEAVIFLIYSLASLGGSVISTAWLFVIDGCQVDCGQPIFL